MLDQRSQAHYPPEHDEEGRVDASPDRPVIMAADFNANASSTSDPRNLTYRLLVQGGTNGKFTDARSSFIRHRRLLSAAHFFTDERRYPNIVFNPPNDKRRRLNVLAARLILHGLERVPHGGLVAAHVTWSQGRYDCSRGPRWSWC